MKVIQDLQHLRGHHRFPQGIILRHINSHPIHAGLSSLYKLGYNSVLIHQAVFFEFAKRSIPLWSNFTILLQSYPFPGFAIITQKQKTTRKRNRIQFHFIVFQPLDAGPDLCRQGWSLLFCFLSAFPMLRIRDVYPGSRIQGQKDFGSRIRIRINKKFKYF